MRVYNRDFCDNGNDYEKMWEFLINDYTDKEDGFIWTTGRLGDWKYGYWNESKCFPRFQRENARLWFNDFNVLVGFVISENGENDFTVFAKRGCEYLFAEMLGWLKENWSNRDGSLNTEVPEHYDVYIKALERAGFEKKELIAVTRQYVLSEKVNEKIVLDKDFIIKDFSDNPDCKSKAKLFKSAFEGSEEVSEFDLLKNEYTRECPCYNPELDLSVIDKNGVYVASCVAYVDYRNNYAEIEKICTHSEYRRMGLAEAVIRECFERLYARGIKHAYITGFSDEAKNLYNKLGAAKSRNWFKYELK